MINIFRLSESPMPIYEFSCQSCGHITEVIQKLSDPYPKQCEKCGSSSLKKIISSISQNAQLSSSAGEEKAALQAVAEKPLTPKRVGKWVKDSKGHKVKVED